MRHKSGSSNKRIISKVIGQIQKFLAPKDPNRFDFTVDHLLRAGKNISRLANIKGQLLSSEILNNKKSDTVFILGSGPSINEISDSQWSHISEFDSIGFNFWAAHDLVPNFYALQLFNNYANRIQFKLFIDKMKEYQSVTFLVRGSWLTREEVDGSFLNFFRDEQVYYVNEYAIHSECSIEPQKLIDYFDTLGFLEQGIIQPCMPKIYSTVSSLMNLCFVMGYQNIVLCGIDMTSPSHFWDNGKYKRVKDKYRLLDESRSNVMMLNDKENKKFTVPEVIYAQADYYKRKNGVDVYIANRNTVLYPHIKLYF